MPPIPTRLSLVKLFLESSLFAPALLVLQGVIATDDQDVEAWYLEGWCFFMMAEQAQENEGQLDGLTWQELARDSRDCLETCKTVRPYHSPRYHSVTYLDLSLAACQPGLPRQAAARACRRASCEIGRARYTAFS